MTENQIINNKDSRHELRDLVASQLKLMLDANNLQGAKSLLIPVQPVDIAEAIGDLPEAMQLIAFRLLNKTEAIDVYEHLDYTTQQSLIEEFKRQDVLDIVDKMSPDDRARLFDELPASVVKRILAQLSPEERQATNLLLGYEENTAGRIMTPEYTSSKANITLEETLNRLRSHATISELIYYIYVTDESRHLTGVVSLKDLVTHEPQQTLGEIMKSDVIYIKTDMDQEEVAKVVQRYDFLAVPVVDRELRLVGIVTVDDVIDIIEKEATEDIYALGAVQSDGDNYFETNLFTVARRRVTWLLVLLFTNTITGSIIGGQEELLTRITVLAAFIPLLIGSGGNIGTQSSTVVIRGLSTDELKDLGVGKVIFREAIAGALLGLGLGLITILWAYLLPQSQRNLTVAVTVGISLMAISILASIAGSGLPFLFKLLKLDPALMSGPFISTAVDVLGVLIYFSIAGYVLGF
ncbi:magnesium transporter [Cyanobacterium stanieri LEGE 03274]|uniref:Magnesium transporter MgtE n=1 Tax=Cyanobacterium stanieri LEGE 03274 TaxID=1828756 RepID=A0ABR9V2S2_9CHRO|nr:magnesium transporter [Cyanobacterium stanieri]MBE9221406.1 magnesium transporter [Cyanobacterium stanieri LEGE 03274]